jgi:AAA domain
MKPAGFWRLNRVSQRFSPRDDSCLSLKSLRWQRRTGPRQVGKTTLSQQLLSEFPRGQYLNFDVAAHRSVIQTQSWRASAPLLVLDEIHKMRNWKAWPKGVYDGRSPRRRTRFAN